jgi:hypothetical protein
MSLKEDQTWWDAVCNCNPENECHFFRADVLSHKQWQIYTNIRTSSGLESALESALDISAEERFMYLCFLHYADIN